MKKLACSLVIALVMGLSVNTFAQKTTAFLNTQTSKKVLDERTALVTFQLDNVKDEQTKKQFENSFKAFKGVSEVTATLAPNNMCNYAVKMSKTETAESLQNMLAIAGIETANVDGQKVEVKNLAQHFHSLKRDQQKTK
jgi:uncharacterized membrane protein YraQ (UPF0718 family)